MPRAVPISVCVVLLVALRSAAVQGGVTIQITGPVQVIVGCNANGTSQIGHEDQCGVARLDHVHENDCTNTTNHMDGPAAEQCTGGGGVVVENGDRCKGTLKFLHNSCNDHCICCVPDKQGCPEGFMVSNGSSQCFKIFKDEKCSWETAKTKCEAEGLIMAKPSDAVAVALRKDLLDTYGNGYVWLDARGDGFKLMWQRDHMELMSDNPLWGPGHPEDSVTTHHCLGLAVWDSYWSRYPEQPYYSYRCSKPSLYTLCEMIME